MFQFLKTLNFLSRNISPGGRVGESCKHPYVIAHVMLQLPAPTLATPQTPPQPGLTEEQDRMRSGRKVRDCAQPPGAFMENLCKL